MNEFERARLIDLEKDRKSVDKNGLYRHVAVQQILLGAPSLDFHIRNIR